MTWLLNILDRLTERRVRAVASQHGRRSFVTRLGTALVGGAILPMLPFDRSGQFVPAFIILAVVVALVMLAVVLMRAPRMGEAPGNPAA